MDKKPDLTPKDLLKDPADTLYFGTSFWVKMFSILALFLVLFFGVVVAFLRGTPAPDFPGLQEKAPVQNSTP
jgi:hypothetical protein